MSRALNAYSYDGDMIVYPRSYLPHKEGEVGRHVVGYSFKAWDNEGLIVFHNGEMGPEEAAGLGKALLKLA